MALKLATVLAAATLGGCFWTTTKSEGQALRRDVTSLQTRIDSKEKELDTQIKQLNTVLEEASKVLKRNTADIGADVGPVRAPLADPAPEHLAEAERLLTAGLDLLK